MNWPNIAKQLIKNGYFSRKFLKIFEDEQFYFMFIFEKRDFYAPDKGAYPEGGLISGAIEYYVPEYKSGAK